MRNPQQEEERPVYADCLARGGEMGVVLRATDWSRTPLGPVGSWPQSLRTAASIVLSSKFGMYIAWGRSFTQLYNDAYRPILGASKHPAAGKSSTETFAEIWTTIGPLFDKVLAGEAVAYDDLAFSLDRNGYLEECFFTFSFSPIRDDSGVPGGVLVTTMETTSRAVTERRTVTLRELANRAATARTAVEAWSAAAAVLSENPADLPFAALYALEDGAARRVGLVHLDAASGALPAQVALADGGGWPLAEAARTGRPVVVAGIAARFGELRGPVWPEPVTTAVVLPIMVSRFSQPDGFLVAGVSPRRALDESYLRFLESAVDPIATALSNARWQARTDDLKAREQQERERLEELFLQVPVAVAVLRGPEHRFELANPLYADLVGRRPLLGRTVAEAFPELAGQGFYELLDKVYATGEPIAAREVPIRLELRGKVENLTIDLTYQPLRPLSGKVNGIMVVGVDVSEQALARKLLHRSEERYRSLLDHARQIVWTNSPEGEMRGEQPGWARITGQTQAEYEGFGWTDAVHPDDRAPTVAAWQRAVAARAVFEHEHRVRAPGAEYREYQIRAVPVLEKDGTIREWVGVHTDMTAQRAAERVARLERERLRSVLDQAPVPIAIMRGPEQVFEMCNELYKSLAARDPTGRKFRDAFPEFAGQGIYEIFDTVYQTGRPFIAREFPARMTRAGEATPTDGFFTFIYQPLFETDGTVSGTMLLVYEVTDQVRARLAVEKLAESLRVSEQHFRSLAEAIPQQVWTSLPDGQLDFVNSRVLQYFGRGFDEMIGAGWQGVVHADDLPRVISRWVHSLQTGEPYEVEFRLRRAADGVFRWNLAQALCMRDAHGAIVKWFGSNTDIHDRKQAADERERLIAALERSNGELDQFAYVASHDLKAPLRGIANLSEWLEEDLGLALNEPAKDKLQKLRGRVHRMEALIDGILDYSRAGRVRHKAERVEVSRLLTEAVELLAPRAGAQVDIGAGMPVLTTEKVPLQQVFMNLIGNALKHARRDDAKVYVRVSGDARFHRFTVKDNGQGIAPEFHDRIWGIFQTLEARDKVEGAGIGLAVVRKIVESRGGAAWVESTPGSGAEFHFTWPRHEGSP